MEDVAAGVRPCEPERSPSVIETSETAEIVKNLITVVKELKEMVQKIGEQNYQLREVVKELADGQRLVREDISEALGKITESSWF